MRFKEEQLNEIPFSGTLEENPHYRIDAVHLDHRIPCLAFALKERFHINIDRNALDRMGLAPGPWLKRLKQAIWEEKADEAPIEVRRGGGKEEADTPMKVGELREKVVTITAGQKIVYVPDCRHTEENVAKILSLGQGATARQAGLIAREAGAKTLKVFHFSPRYEDRPQSLVEEAQDAFTRG
jgi:ribonuclease Z